MTQAPSKRSIIEQALEYFNDPSRRDQYFDLYAGDVILHGVGIEPGLDSLRRYYAAIWGAFPDLRVEVEDTVESDDKVALRFTLRGTHLGPFHGLAATGRTIAVAGMTILRFAELGDEPKCVERWTISDGLALMAQLRA